MKTTVDLVRIAIDRSALKTTMICSSVLLLKMMVANFMIGGARIKAGTRPPEDQKLFPDEGYQSFLGRDEEKENQEAKEMEQRCIRIGLNDLENIPISLIVNWGCLLTCYSVRVHIWMTIAFTIGRILHHITYYKKMQPHRALAWFLAWVAMFGFTINGVIGAIYL